MTAPFSFVHSFKSRGGGDVWLDVESGVGWCGVVVATIDSWWAVVCHEENPERN